MTQPHPIVDPTVVKDTLTDLTPANGLVAGLAGPQTVVDWVDEVIDASIPSAPELAGSHLRVVGGFVEGGSVIGHFEWAVYRRARSTDLEALLVRMRLRDDRRTAARMLVQHSLEGLRACAARRVRATARGDLTPSVLRDVGFRFDHERGRASQAIQDLVVPLINAAFIDRRIDAEERHARFAALNKPTDPLEAIRELGDTNATDGLLHSIEMPVVIELE